MKDKKAAGYDGIVAEQFKYAGPKCIQIVTQLFNSICKIEKAPFQFKQGVLIPIPKGDKDQSLQDNNRGITLLPTVRKIFEKSLMNTKISKWVKENQIIDDLQGAAQDHCSSLETNWVVRETICHYLEQNSKVYVCMLDVKKAFDSVWQKGLFHKLYNAGIDPKVWRIIMDLYSEPQFCVRIGDNLSDWITGLQGIIQGAPFSMFNYEVTMNDLTKKFKKCGAGTVIGPNKTTSPTFADDTVLLAPTRTGLQRLLNIAFKHSSQWRYEYNARKCATVVFGGDKMLEAPFKMGNAYIRTLAAHEHVGTILSSSKWDTIKYIKERIVACNKPGYAIMSLGNCFAPMTPISASTLYWSVCVPKLTYAYQIMDIPAEALNLAECYHAKLAKTIQGLPEQASNLGAVASIGWMSLKGYIDMITLLYFMRMINLPTDCIYKRIFILRYCHHIYGEPGKHLGPVKEFIDLCKEYDLLDIIKAAVEECVIPSKNEWKKLVKDKIWKMENRNWQIKSTLYTTLAVIKNVLPQIEIISWWRHAQENPAETKKCRSVMKLLLDCHQLKSCRYRHNEGASDPFCDYCQCRVIENPSHVLFECDGNADIRKDLWDKVIVCCPDALAQQMQTMTVNDKAGFILTGLGNSYIPEWTTLFKQLANYIHKLYITRLAKSQ